MSKAGIVAQSKQAERDAAEALDHVARRLHAGEWAGAGDVDIIGHSFYGQVKQRKDVAGYIQEGMRQLDEAGGERKHLERLQPGICKNAVPLLVIITKPGSGKRKRTYVMIDIDDYVNKDTCFAAEGEECIC